MDTRNPQDDELVERLRNRDETAITDLLRRYGGKATTLLRLMLATVRRKVDPEDVLQDVLMKVWNGIHTFDPNRGNFRGWFFQLVKNQGIDELRRNGKCPQPVPLPEGGIEDQHGDAPDEESMEPSPEGSNHIVEAIRMFLDGLDELTRRIGGAYVHVWPDQPDLRSLGVELGLSPEAVRKR